jgi:uncharacterized FlgJ-related protein
LEGGNPMAKSSKDFDEYENIELYDYIACKDNVDKIFSKYREYNSKKEIIESRVKNSLNLESLGIFSSGVSDPTYNKVEQLDKINNFLETVNKVFETCNKELSSDEEFIYKKYLEKRYTDEDLATMLNLSVQSIFLRKRSLYVRVARWYDVEVKKVNK